MTKHLCTSGPDGTPCNRIRVGEAYDITRDCRPCWLFAHNREIRLAWGGDDKVSAADHRPVHRPDYAHRPQAPDIGPGTELTKLLDSLGIKKAVGCQCGAKAAEMNAWGVAGCKERRDEIAGWLRDNAKQHSLWNKTKATVLAFTQGVALQLNPADPFGSLVDLAIQRAEELAHKDQSLAQTR